jgi:osmoprotectant transport system substrate-binding protein
MIFNQQTQQTGGGMTERQPRARRGTRRRARRGRAARRIVTALAASVVLTLLLAACGSSNNSKSNSTATSSTTSAAGPGAGKPAITIGDKNFAEEYILGNLYAEALRGKGYTVKLEENIGSSELIWKALKAGKIEMYPEYTGTLLSAVAEQTKEPTSEKGAYEEAKAFAEKNGFTLLEQTPFSDSDALATTPAYAEKHNLKTIADLKALGKSLVLGGPAEFATRYLGLKGLKALYGVVPTFKPFSIELSYKALESGESDVQVVFTTDGQLLGGKFKVLEDTKHLFGFQNVAPVVKQSLVSEEGPAFAETLNKVSALLTTAAIQQMNKAVSIDKQSPATVAKQFLSANGLG